MKPETISIDNFNPALLFEFGWFDRRLMCIFRQIVLRKTHHVRITSDQTPKSINLFCFLFLFSIFFSLPLCRFYSTINFWSRALEYLLSIACDRKIATIKKINLLQLATNSKIFKLLPRLQMELKCLSYMFDANANELVTRLNFFSSLCFGKNLSFIFGMSACHVFLRRIRMESSKLMTLRFFPRRNS